MNIQRIYEKSYKILNVDKINKLQESRKYYLPHLGIQIRSYYII